MANWKIEVKHLNVGNGDAAILIVYNSNTIEKVLLIDGGPNFKDGGPALLDETKNLLKNTEKKVDGIILTHDDKDHVLGVTTFLKSKDANKLLEETLFYEQGVNRNKNKRERKALFEHFNNNPKLFTGRKIIKSFASDNIQKATNDTARNKPGSDNFYFFSLGKEFLWNWSSFALPGMYKEDGNGNFTSPDDTLKDRKMSINKGNSDYFRTKAKIFDEVRLKFIGETLNVFLDKLGSLQDRIENNPPTVLDNLVTVLTSVSLDKLEIIVDSGSKTNFGLLKEVIGILRKEVFDSNLVRETINTINGKKKSILKELSSKLSVEEDVGKIKIKIEQIVKIATSIEDKPALLCIGVNEQKAESSLYIVNDGDTPQNHRSIGCILLSSKDEIIHYLSGDLTDLEEVDIANWLKNEGYSGKKRVPFMKFSHHGARGSTPKQLLEALQPQNTIASASSANYMHPSMELLYYIKFFNETISNTTPIKIHATNYPQYLSYLNYQSSKGSSPLQIISPDKEILWSNSTKKYKDALIEILKTDLEEVIKKSIYKDKDCEKELISEFQGLSSEEEQKKLLKEFGENQLYRIKKHAFKTGFYSYENGSKALDLLLTKKENKKRKHEEILLSKIELKEKKEKLEEFDDFKDLLKTIDETKLQSLDFKTQEIERVLRAKEYLGNLDKYISNKYNDSIMVWERIGGFPNDQNYYRKEKVIDQYKGGSGYVLYAYTTGTKPQNQNMSLSEVESLLLKERDIKKEEILNYLPLLLKYPDKSDKDAVSVIGYKEYKDGAALDIKTSTNLKKLTIDRIPSERYPDYFSNFKKQLTRVNIHQIEPELYEEIEKCSIFPKDQYKQIKSINTIYDESKTIPGDRIIVEAIDIKNKQVKVVEIETNLFDPIETDIEENYPASTPISLNPVRGSIIRLGIIGSKNVDYRLDPYSPLAAFIGQTSNCRIQLEVISFVQQQQTVTLSAILNGNLRQWLAMANVFVTKFDIVAKVGGDDVWSVESCSINSNLCSKNLLKDKEWLELKGEINPHGKLILTINSEPIRNNILSNAQFLKCINPQAPIVNIIKQLLNELIELPIELNKTQIALTPNHLYHLQTKLVSDFGTIRLSDNLSLNKVHFGFSREIFSKQSWSANVWNTIFIETLAQIGNFNIAVAVSLSDKGIGNFSIVPDKNMTTSVLLKLLLPGSEAAFDAIEKVVKINLAKSLDVTFDLAAQNKVVNVKLIAGIELESFELECGINFPDINFWAHLANDNTIKLKTLAEKYWQNNELDFLPAVDIDELGVSVYPITKEFTFHSKVSSGEFKIAGINFKVEEWTLDINKTDKGVNGEISAEVTINKTSLYLSANFTNKIKFKGSLSNLKLSDLLKDLAGIEIPATLPDLKFDHLDFTASPSDQNFSINGNVSFIWKINDKEWMCHANLKLSKEGTKDFNVELTISSQSEFSLTDEFVFKNGTIHFGFEKKYGINNWKGNGNLQTSIFAINSAMTVSYDHGIDKQTLKLSGNIGSEQQTLIDFGITSVFGSTCSLEISKTENLSTGFFKITGGFNIKGLGTTTGFLKLYKEPTKQGLVLELDEVSLLIVPKSFKVSPKDIALKLKAPRLLIEKTNLASAAEWYIDTSVKASLEGIPAYLTELKAERTNIKFIPDELEINVKIGKNKFEIEGGFNTYIDINLPDVKIGNINIELNKLGTSRLAFKKIKANIGAKPSLTATVGFALPSKLNHLLFGKKGEDAAFKLFKVFNEAGGGTGSCDIEVGFGYISQSDESPNVIIKLLENSLPFENYVTPENGKWKINMGDFGAILVDPFVFRSNGSKFTATFGYEIDPKKPLRIPLTPLKELLKRSKLDQAANLLPVSLPLMEFELYDRESRQLKTEELKRILYKLALEAKIDDFSGFIKPIDEAGTLAGKLPDDLKDYLNFKLPQKLEISLSLNADAGINLSVVLGENDELKVLFPTLAPLPALQGIKLKGFSFGTLMGGSLLSLQMNMIFDQFDLLSIIIGLNLPDNENIPPLSTVQKRLIIKDLWMLVIYYSGVPIPVPIFYDHIELKYLGIEGIEMSAKAEFPMPKFELPNLLRLLDKLRKFVSKDDYRLSENIEDLDRIIDFKLSNVYIKTPKYLSSYIIGKEGDLIVLDPIKTTAKVLDGFKFLDLKDLVQLIPEKHRTGKYDIRFGPLTLKGGWWITTLKEFRTTPNRPVDIDPTQIQNYLPARNPYYKDDVRIKDINWLTTDKDGVLVWLKNRVDIQTKDKANIQSIGYLDVAFGLVCIDAQGLFTGVRMDGQLGPFELKLGGALSIQKNQNNQIQTVLHAQSSLLVANLSVFDSKTLVMIAQNSFAINGRFDLFKDLPLQLRGEMTGTIDSKGLRYRSDCSCNLGLVNMANVTVKLFAHKDETINGFWIESKLFNQDLIFNITVEGSTVSLQLKAGQWVRGSIIKTTDHLITNLTIDLEHLCSLTFSSKNGLQQISATARANLKLLGGMVNVGGEIEAKPGIFVYKNGYANLIPAGLPLSFEVSKLYGELKNQSFTFSGQFNSSVTVGYGVYVTITTGGGINVSNHTAYALLESDIRLDMDFWLGRRTIWGPGKYSIGFKVTRLTNNRTCFIATWNLRIWPLSGEKNRVVIYTDSRGGVEVELCREKLSELPEYPSELSSASDHMMDNIKAIKIYPSNNGKFTRRMPKGLIAGEDVKILSLPDYILHALHEDFDLETKIKENVFFGQMLKSSILYEIEQQKEHKKIVIKHNEHTAGFFGIILTSILSRLEVGAARDYLVSHFNKMKLEFFLKKGKLHVKLHSEEYPACLFNIEKEFSFFNPITLFFYNGPAMLFIKGWYMFGPPFLTATSRSEYSNLLQLVPLVDEEPEKGYLLFTQEGWYLSNRKEGEKLSLTENKSDAAILLPVFENNLIYLKQHPSQGSLTLTFRGDGSRMTFEAMPGPSHFIQRFSYSFTNEFTKHFSATWKTFFDNEIQNNIEEKPLSLREYTLLYMFSNNDFDKDTAINRRVKKTEVLMKISTPNSYHFGRFLVEFTETNRLFFDREKTETKGIPHHADIEYKNGNLKVTFTDWTLDKEFKLIKDNYQFTDNH